MFNVIELDMQSYYKSPVIRIVNDIPWGLQFMQYDKENRNYKCHSDVHFRNLWIFMVSHGSAEAETGSPAGIIE